MYGDNPASSSSSLDCKGADYLLGEDYFVTEPEGGSLENLVVKTGTSGINSNRKGEPANPYCDISDNEDSGWARSLSGNQAMFGPPPIHAKVTWSPTSTMKPMDLESEHDTSKQTNPEHSTPNNTTSEDISKTQIQKLTLLENMTTQRCLCDTKKCICTAEIMCTCTVVDEQQIKCACGEQETKIKEDKTCDTQCDND